MARIIDDTYCTEKLLDWERKSLTGQFMYFSFSKKSNWITVGVIILGLSAFGLVVPFIPPRYGWRNWTPAATTEEYWDQVTKFLVTAPMMILAVLVYLNIRIKIDLKLGIKRTANFKVTDVLTFGSIKILLMNGWRPFSIGARQSSYFNSVKKGHIISIKRTATFRLINYYIQDEKEFLKGPVRGQQ